jgi:imidazolonepropionase-like amidohydrolase
LYTRPGATPLDNATLVINNGRIVAVHATQPNIIAGTHIDASGLTATAGLWNNHVHFTDPELENSPQQIIDSMLLRNGFTQVVDTGSVPASSLKLRQSIRAEKLRGPKILLANGSFVYTDGTPSYLPGIKLPEVTAVAQAKPMVDAFLDMGVDGIKIFSGSFQTPEHTIYLPPDIVSAITKAAHARNAFVFAHPTTMRGFSNAVRGGVDVIAHTTARETQMPAELIALMLRQDTAIVPTLKLWRYEINRLGLGEQIANAMEAAAVSQLAQLHNAGVEILFGTDVGYMADYDTTAEYELMLRAGMDWPAILTSLTTAPAMRFGDGDHPHRGTLSIGEPADITIFMGDPAQDISNLARVAYTIVDGRVVFSRQF